LVELLWLKCSRSVDERTIDIRIVRIHNPMVNAILSSKASELPDLLVPLQSVRRDGLTITKPVPQLSIARQVDFMAIRSINTESAVHIVALRTCVADGEIDGDTVEIVIFYIRAGYNAILYTGIVACAAMLGNCVWIDGIREGLLRAEDEIMRRVEM